MKTLVSWIGYTDIKVLLEGATDSLRSKIAKIVNNRGVKVPVDGGPISITVKQESFDKIHFLSDLPQDLTKMYTDWLGLDVNATYVDLKNPTDYGETYAVVDKFLTDVANLYDKIQLSMLLSPRTPSMAAIWVLLGKTKYNASFWRRGEIQGRPCIQAGRDLYQVTSVA